RVDDCIVFRKLTQEDTRQIALRLLEKLQKRMADLGVEVEFSPEIVAQIAEEGFDPVYGARPLRRAIQTRLEDPLAEEMLAGHIRAGVPAVCVFENGSFQFRRRAVFSAPLRSAP